MSSIVLSIVNLATGAVFNSVCDHVANKLKQGDCADEKCRQLIVRELDEIKSKLDGLARKDLRSSVCFLKDGLCLLNYTVDDATDASDAYPTHNFIIRTSEQNKNEEELPFTITKSNEAFHSQISKFNKALIHSPLATSSKERFASGKVSFETAYTKATEAFNNEALSTTERILATKLRVVAKILECLDDPELAMAFCKLYLQQLHELPAVRKRFAVFFRSQVKSHLHKKKRASNIRSVLEINYALYEYARLFTRTGLGTLSIWPSIKLRNKAFNPLFKTDKLLRKVEKCGPLSPNQFLFKDVNYSECVAVNSKGEIITKNKDGKGLALFSNNADIISLFSFDSETTQRSCFHILAITTDVDDSVYAVTRHKTEEVFVYKLHKIDSSLGRVKLQMTLGSLAGSGESHHRVCIAVDENKNIFITKQDEAKVFVFEQNGILKHDFTLEDWDLIKDIKISSKGDVIAAELVGKDVDVYTKNGELRDSLIVPSLHKVCGLAFDYIEDVIILLTEVCTGSCCEYRLESYSECGELLQILVLPRQKKTGGYRITSHPSGPVAVVHRTGVTFLHS